MDNQAYLDQITASTQPTKGSGNHIIPPLVLKLLIGGVILAVLIIIFGSILGNLNPNAEELSKQLSYRLDNVNATIEKYNPNVQSSQLRSKGTATKTVLTDTKRKLDSFLEEKYGFKADPKSETATIEQKHIDAVNKKLENARLNAYLDRIYVHELSHQVELIMAMEADINAHTDNNKLKEIVNNSLNSLKEIDISIQQTAETIK